ncbi:MAG: type II secretion system F family protein [Planctomycetaceae bacterium]|nr:type II secretion system F family protein [Planctomycetaceae bacterium]
MTQLLLCLIAAGGVYTLWQLRTLCILLWTTERGGPSAQNAPPLRSWSPQLAALLPESEQRRQTQIRQLRACGYQGPSTWTGFQALRFALTATPMLAGLICVNLAGVPMQPILLVMTAVLPVVGWSLPGMVIARKASARQAAITAALPDLLTLLNASVQSGHSIARATSDVVDPMEHLHPELAAQLQVLHRRSTVASWDQAVGELGDTFPGSAISRVCRLLQQSHRLGNQLGDTLLQHADDITDVQAHEAEQTMQRVSVQLLFPVVLCLLPAVFVHLAGPSLLAVEDFHSSNSGLLKAVEDSSDTAGRHLRIPLGSEP